MQKTLLSLLLFFIFCDKAHSQDSTVNSAEPAFDSLALMKDLLDLLDSANTPESYGMATIGIGNRVFSLHNNQLNARQTTTSTLVYNPSIGYFHKSGFSISAGATLLNDATKGFGTTQYSITPAFDMVNKNWSFGVSYSRYFIKDRFSPYSSPVQNDLYMYAGYKKTWLEPGIAVGYSTGNFNEINSFTILLTGNTYTDTGTYKLKAFSLTGSVSHDFQWSSLFSKDDALEFTPSLMLNCSADSTENVSHTIGQNLIRFLKRRKRLPRLSGKNNFQAQSVALSIDLNYSIGKFNILPQLYLDYYLPATDEKRLTQTFTFAVGYTF